MKLIEALETLKKKPSPEAAAVDVHLICGFTPLHFLTFLTAHLKHQFPGQRVSLSTGLFGDLAGNLERLERERADVVAVVIEWADLDPRLGIRRLGGWRPGQLEDLTASVRNQVARLYGLLETAGYRRTVGLALPTLPLPPAAVTPTWQFSAFENDMREIVASLGARASRFRGVRVVSSQRLDRFSPLASRLDVKSELSTGFPYSLAHADVLAELMARTICTPAPQKGLITDLDDTLWKGILGEVNIDGIAWDLDHHAQSHGLYQQLLVSLADAGVLIGVASKNDPALVEEVFRKAQPILPRQLIFPLEANWGPKSASVSKILRAWNIGAESVVFVDDNPLDLAEVQSAFPQIECMPFPRGDEAAAYHLLFDLRDRFGKQTISEEDGIRLASIRASQAASSVMESSGTSTEHFLKEAEGRLALWFCEDSPDPRALELINKTNQFNLNGKRHTEASWREYLSDPNVFLLVGAYEDKFGPLGKIAVIAGSRQDRRLQVDHWVMSCRAFSRRIEHGSLLYLFRRFELEAADFDFVATPRNGPLQEFFLGLTGKAPSGSFAILRQQLVDNCPAVYLQILEQHGD
jgi:FkbH-like protein